MTRKRHVNSVWPRRLALLAAASCLAPAASAHASQQAEWRLAESPEFEVGRDGEVWLNRVQDAVFTADGSLVIADAGNNRMLRLSPSGEVTDSLGREGNGPGEFQHIYRLYASGDTLFAYDSGNPRITAWVPGQDPEVVSLPTVRGYSTTIHGVASPTLWLVSTSENAGEGRTGMRERWSELLVFDPISRTTRTLGRRQIGYQYFFAQQHGHTTYRTQYLGEAQLAASSGRWFFVPLHGPGMEVGDASSGDSREVVLPMEPHSYRQEGLRASWEPLLSRTTGSSRSRIRAVYADLRGKLPRRDAPLARNVLVVGDDVWLERYAPEAAHGGAEEPEWIVVSPADGALRATLKLDRGLELLAATADLAAVLTTTELGEEIVQVRRVLR